MKFELPPLPYAKDALEPHMSRETLEYHYEKHHRGYLEKLKKLIEGKPEAKKSLEEIIRTATGSVFNDAAQVWNHTFFWHCMEPNGGGRPGGEVDHLLKDAFGSYDKFHQQFVEAGDKQFGSGWVWLIRDRDRKLKIISTADADNPLTKDQTPLLTCDVWEHAYYIDYRHERPKYLETFLRHLVNWDRIAECLQQAA